MVYEDLSRVIDQVRPTREQENAILAGLLKEERKEPNMKMGRKLPRLAAVGLAAAIVVTACAAAAVMKLDQRLLSYFGGTPKTEGLLTPAAMVVDKKKTSEGTALHLQQVVADRYSVVALMELTAPEGTVLDGEYYVLDYDVEATAPDGSRLDSFGFGWRCLEDEDPLDNRISLMFKIHCINNDFNFLGSKLSLAFEGLYSDNLRKEPILSGKWKYAVTLPNEDPGIYVTAEASITVDGTPMGTLRSLYVSPISLVWGVEGGEGGTEPIPLEPLHEREDWPEQVYLITAAGETVSVRDFNCLHTQHKTDIQDKERGYYSFSLAEIVDPAEIVSVSIFGQVFEMAG